MRSLRVLMVPVLVAGFGLASASLAGSVSAQPGAGGNLNAFETRVQTAAVGADVDTVSSTQSLSGLRSWQLGLGNFGSTPVAGAQITVHSASRTLNDAAQFRWTWQIFAGQGPPQGSPQPCTTSASDVSCPAAGAALSSGGGLQAFSNGQPGPGGVGLPITLTPPFDSARQQTTNHETVKATLTAASFAGGNLQVDLPNGMAPTPAAQVTTAN